MANLIINAFLIRSSLNCVSVLYIQISGAAGKMGELSCSAVESASPLLLSRITAPSLVHLGHLVSAAPPALLLLLLVGPGVALPHLVHVPAASAAAEHLAASAAPTALLPLHLILSSHHGLCHHGLRHQLASTTHA